MLSKHIDFKGMTNLRDLGGMTNVFEKKIKNNLLNFVDNPDIIKISPTTISGPILFLATPAAYTDDSIE